jgi:hypothetical protein
MAGGKYGQGWGGLYYAEKRRAERQRRVVNVMLFVLFVAVVVVMALTIGMPAGA